MEKKFLLKIIKINVDLTLNKDYINWHEQHNR